MPSSCGKRANCLGEIVMDYGKTVKIAALCMFTLIMFGACAPYKTSETEEIKTDRRIHLCVGDSYDFYAMGYIVDETDKSILSQNGDVVRAEMKGKGLVCVTDMKTGAPAVIEVNAYSTSAELGDRFSVDKGLFKGKNFIVFGDSITDGCLLDPSAPNTLPNGFNYEDTYFPHVFPLFALHISEIVLFLTFLFLFFLNISLAFISPNLSSFKIILSFNFI